MDWKLLVDRVTPVGLDVPAAALTLWPLLGVLVAVLVLTLPGVWRFNQIAVTAVHEVGHAVGGVFAGRRYAGIRLRSDASGVTHTVGHGHGLGLMVCYWSGYTAPSVAGLVFVAAAVFGVAAAAWAAAALILLLCLLRSHSLLTFVVLLSLAAGSAALVWWASPVVLIWVSCVVGMYLIVGGARQIADAWRHRHEDGGAADADALHSLLPLSEVFWLLTFWLVNIVCAAGVIALFMLTLSGWTLSAG